ncbi:trypsin-like peptidase domain-containing protein [Nakamurella sp. GG22]
MPRINDEMPGCVAYLFTNRADAEGAAVSGATGFIVSYELAGTAYSVRYLITNSHVIAQGCRFARLNTRSGTVRIYEIPPDEWTHAAGPDDVAVALLRLPEEDDLQFLALPRQAWSLTPTDATEFLLNVGDEVIMLGRLNYYRSDGSQNRPVARFGTIALMPGEPVRDGRKIEVESFLIEMRSLSGFSGSPVFCIIPPGAFRGPGVGLDLGTGHQFLLGLDCGHIEMTTPVRTNTGARHPDGHFVREHSGMSIVVPAWRIDAVLKQADLVDQRDEILRDIPKPT